MTSRSATYTYEDVADRIAEVLGERPALSTLRAEVTRRPTSQQRQMPRLTTGMPSPLSPRTSPARFSAAAVEKWLANHPRLDWKQARDDIDRERRRGEDLELIVAAALHRGLSWRVIAGALTDSGYQCTTAGLHKRFRHLTDKAPNLLAGALCQTHESGPDGQQR